MYIRNQNGFVVKRPTDLELSSIKKYASISWSQRASEVLFLCTDHQPFANMIYSNQFWLLWKTLLKKYENMVLAGDVNININGPVKIKEKKDGFKLTDLLNGPVVSVWLREP